MAALFTGLVLDLDGCELRFRSLRVEGGGSAASPMQLTLGLGVRVRAFPSLDINF